MATINFYYRSKTPTGNLTIKLQQGREIDVRVSTQIQSDRKYWFDATGKRKNLLTLKTSNLDAEPKRHKSYLENLVDEVLLRFNTDYSNGILITSDWLKNNITNITGIVSDNKEIKKKQEQNELVNKGKQKELEEVKRLNLVTTAINNIIEFKYYNSSSKVHYTSLLKKIDKYQKAKRTTLNTRDVNQMFVNKFVKFLRDDLNYRDKSIENTIRALKASIKYQKNAYPDEVTVSHNLNDLKNITRKKAEVRKEREEIVIPLTISELKRIEKTEVPQHLLRAKRYLLFASETGVRYSDYNKLTKKYIKTSLHSKYWTFYSQKTQRTLVIPINDKILEYIEVYGMPNCESMHGKTITNEKIKVVCKLAGITKITEGAKVQEIKKGVHRKVSGNYPKYELITTHGLRRTFATNYYKILGLEKTRLVTGHASDNQLLEYIDQTMEVTDLVTEMLNKMNTNIHVSKEPKFKVIKKVSNQ